MKLSDFFNDFQPTSDQQSAILQLEHFLNSEGRIFILKGYAGTGKTSMLKGLACYAEELGYQVNLMAPTGRAAKNLAEKTGKEACTIHKSIYQLNKIEETGTKNDDLVYYFALRPEVQNRVLILVDEASMVSDHYSEASHLRFGSGRLLNDLFHYAAIHQLHVDSRIILIGDPAQLPPVNMNFSPAMDENYLNSEYNLRVQSITLTHIVRQQYGNSILTSATTIRKSIEENKFSSFCVKADNQYIMDVPVSDFLSFYKILGDDKIVITYKNKTALSINQQIRKNIFNYGELPVAGDIVINGANNYRLGILNGEFGIIRSFDPQPVKRMINLKYKGGNKQVKLVWYKVEVLFKDENPKMARVVSGYLLENYLFGGPALNQFERRGLLVDFRIRNPHLKSKSIEEKEAFASDPFLNPLLIKYGYAITCHKAQGGEWKQVVVVWDYSYQYARTGKDNMQFFRWAYTAITRSADQLYNFGAPSFSAISGLESTMKKINAASDRPETEVMPLQTVKLDQVWLDLMEKFSVENEPDFIQDHFIRLYHICCRHDIRIKQRIAKPFQEIFLFESDKDLAKIVFFYNGKRQFQKISVMPNISHDQRFAQAIADMWVQHSGSISIVREQQAPLLPQPVKMLVFQDPFLEDFYNRIRVKVDPFEISIPEIKHLQYCERYHFRKTGQEAIIDFLYNSRQVWTTVRPLFNKSANQSLIREVLRIIQNLNGIDQ